METAKIKINGDEEYTATTLSELDKTVERITNFKGTKTDCTPYRIQYAFGYNPYTPEVDIFVNVNLMQDYDLTRNFEALGSRSIICAVENVDFEVNHVVSDDDKSLKRIEESFYWSMRTTVALRKLLDGIDYVIIPIDQLS